MDIADIIGLSENGWPVFPCSPETKAPLTRRGFYDATTDLDQIIKWWTRNPNAMVGVPTGDRTGIFVLDINPFDDTWTCDDCISKIEACLNEPIRPTMSVKTPLGMHLYYK